jgi:hypothetical protein
MEVQNKFLRLATPAALGDRIDEWRVCWLGGWDRRLVFFVVMVVKVSAVADAHQEFRPTRGTSNGTASHGSEIKSS